MAIFSVILGSCLKWVKNLMLHFLFIPIIPVTESHVNTEECFLIVSLQDICYIWTQTTWVLLHTDFFFSNARTVYSKCHGCTMKVKLCMVQRNRNRKGCENSFPLSEKCVGVQGVSSSTAVGGISIFCWEFFEQNPLFLKVASHLLSCTVTLSSRKYSESYQMLLGVQHQATLSFLVIVQLFPCGGILANLSILRTRKYNLSHRCL